jgi:hypothetical protein
MKIMKVSVLFLSLCVYLAVFATSCTNTKPEITYGFIKLVLYQEDSGPQEHFSFFIIPEDDDGIDNLDELYLYHDRELLRWQIKSSDWVSYAYDGNTWIGTRSISNRGGSLPRGVYRAVLVNKGGEKAERSFTYDGSVRFPFPSMEFNEGSYTVSSEWPINRLICYDRSGNYISTISLTSLSGEVSQLRLPSNIVSAALWAEDEDNQCSALTNAISVN